MKLFFVLLSLLPKKLQHRHVSPPSPIQTKKGGGGKGESSECKVPAQHVFTGQISPLGVKTTNGEHILLCWQEKPIIGGAAALLFCSDCRLLLERAQTKLLSWGLEERKILYRVAKVISCPLEKSAIFSLVLDGTSVSRHSLVRNESN